MAIFSRRVVQRNLDYLTPNIPKLDDRQDILSRLNSRRRVAITAEWEVVFAGSFCTVAAVQYQRLFDETGKRRSPDLFVRAESDGNALEFLADIVAPSDEGITKDNPADFFFAEFARIAATSGVGNGGFDIRIGDRQLGNYPDKKRRLLLPPKGEIPSFIRREVRPLFTQVKAEPEAPHVFLCRRTGIEISVAYHPLRNGYNTGGCGLCESPLSLEGNPLFASLNAKATQLRESRYTGIKGIVVADGGCRALSSTNRSGGSPWSRDEIVEHFLTKHPYVDFVTATQCRTIASSSIAYELCHKIYWQRPFDNSKTTKLYPVLNSALKALPRVQETPDNAWRNVRAGRDIAEGWNLGASSWTPGRSLAYSSRTFLALVAGTLSSRNFRRLLNDRMPNRGSLFKFFRDACESRRKLAAVRFSPSPDEDDDLIIFDLEGMSPVDRTRDSRFLAHSCQVPTVLLMRFLARLAYEVLLSDRRHFSLGTLPVDIQAFLRSKLREGRTLVGADLATDGGSIRLELGDRDAAVSNYS